MRRGPDKEFVAVLAAVLISGTTQTVKEAVAKARELVAEVEATTPPEEENERA